MKLLGASARLRDNAQVCLSAQSRQEIESEQQALTELLGEQESSHLWACGYNLCEEGMTALARGILRSQKT